MSRRRPPDSPSLFDLPLDPPEPDGAGREEEAPRKPADEEAPALVVPPRLRPPAPEDLSAQEGAPPADDEAEGAGEEESGRPPIFTSGLLASRDDEPAPPAASQTGGPPPRTGDVWTGRPQTGRAQRELRASSPMLPFDDPDPLAELDLQPDENHLPFEQVPASGATSGASMGELGPPPEREEAPEVIATEYAPAALSDRFRAGLADVAVHAVVGLLGLLGAELMGARPTLSDLPALAVFLLAFSFLYTVANLAFWGRTPGMSWAALVTVTPDGETLTFAQTVRRWAVGVLTAALAGLPTLAAFGGRPSLTDRLSGSVTLRRFP